MPSLGNFLSVGHQNVGGTSDAPPVITSVTLDNTTPTRGNIITCTIVGTHIVTKTYQWKDGDDNNLSGETNQTYTADSSLVGGTVRCVAHVENSFGTDDGQSALTSIITGIPINTAAPVCTSDGTNPALPGDALSTTNGTWNAYPAPTYTYTNTGVNGGTLNTVLVALADVDNEILFNVTATNALGNANTDSNPISVVL